MGSLMGKGLGGLKVGGTDSRAGAWGTPAEQSAVDALLITLSLEQFSGIHHQKTDGSLLALPLSSVIELSMNQRLKRSVSPK